MTDSAKVLGELLAKLERREADLMEWGFLEVVHTSEEIVELFANDPEWGSAFVDLAQGSEELFVDNLAECHLLHRVADGYPRSYRSRFAESIRLLARLKQRFKPDDWTHAPELVSQVRLHLAPRRFPVRDQGLDAVWDTVAPSAWAHAVQFAVLQALMGGERPLHLAAFQVRAITRILAYYRGAEAPTGTVVTAGTGAAKPSPSISRRLWALRPTSPPKPPPPPEYWPCIRATCCWQTSLPMPPPKPASSIAWVYCRGRSGSGY